MTVTAAPPARAPLAAATVLVVRAAEPAPAADLEVLLVRRSHRASFMANAYVFPGGRVDAADAADAAGPGGAPAGTSSVAAAGIPAAAGASPPDHASCPSALAAAGIPAAAGASPPDHASRPSALAAAGLPAVAGAAADPASAAAALQAARRAAARELAEEVGLQVSDLAHLVRFAHWITPSAEPKRFDTQFFLWPLLPLAAAPDPATAATALPAALPEVRVDGREVFDPLWITPTEALARYAAGALNLPPPTACTLEDLAAEIAAAQAHAAAAGSLLAALLRRCASRRPLPTLPKFFADDQGLAIVMPWDPAYAELSGDGVPLPALAEDAAPVPRRIRRCLLRLESVGANYAIVPPAASPPDPGAAPAAGSGPGSGPSSRPAPAPSIPWTIERADS